MAIKYLNPYTASGTKYTAGLNSIVAVLEPLYPNQSIDDVVNAVYTYITTTYTMDPDPVNEQNLKSIIYAIVNGYLNYSLNYNPQQTQYIHLLIGETLSSKNPEDILPRIEEIEEEVAESGMPIEEQMPILYATAIGKAACAYWANVVTTPGGWANFITSFTPAVVKYPYWVAASMQGALIGLNIPNNSQLAKELELILTAIGGNILLSLSGALAVCSGKVVFNLQQKKQSSNIFQTS